MLKHALVCLCLLMLESSCRTPSPPQTGAERASAALEMRCRAEGIDSRQCAERLASCSALLATIKELSSRGEAEEPLIVYIAADNSIVEVLAAHLNGAVEVRPYHESLAQHIMTDPVERRSAYVLFLGEATIQKDTAAVALGISWALYAYEDRIVHLIKRRKCWEVVDTEIRFHAG